MPEPGTFRTSDRSAVEWGAAVKAWAGAARTVLLRVAQRYHAEITYKQLALEVQAATGISTRSLLRNWIGDVLEEVALDAQKCGEPIITALCVRQDGTMGPGYMSPVVRVYGSPPEDLEQQGAEERLKCYRYFGAADLPADGGAPKLNGLVARKRLRATPKAEQREEVCPQHHLRYRAGGECPACS